MIDASGKKVWINTEHGCAFRACDIKNLVVVDKRDGVKSEDE